jgi:hypothetical protein
MRIRFTIATLACVVGCQPQDTETTVQQAESDCFGVANYCDAKLPAIAPFAGQLPGITPTTVLELQANPFKTDLSYVIAADWAKGEILWVVSYTTAEVPKVMALVSHSEAMWGGTRPPPPPPPPSGIDPRKSLEIALRMAPIDDAANAAIAACSKK